MANTQLGKCVTVRKWVPVGEISHTQKDGQGSLRKWVAYRKIRHS